VTVLTPVGRLRPENGQDFFGGSSRPPKIRQCPVKNVDKDTVATWLDRASQHIEAVSHYLMVNLHFEAVQLDEFWSFVQKKKPSVRLWNDSCKHTVTGGSG
jgi:hypothetical protein